MTNLKQLLNTKQTIICSSTFVQCNFCCRLRSVRNYWIGLYKNESRPNSSAYWLDGNPSRYRKNPKLDKHVHCVTIIRTLLMSSSDGDFQDFTCSREDGYICKNAAGVSQLYIFI